MLKTAALLVLLVAAGGSNAQDYCALCANHTMCVYPEEGPDCALMLASGTTPDDASLILWLHNTYRARVAEGNVTAGINGAANMRRMIWDADLATVAQRWANQCGLEGHDACRNDPRFAEVGQSVALWQSSATDGRPDWDTTLYYWFRELVDFDQERIDPFVPDEVDTNRPTERYTQMVWADSVAVGCGFASFVLADAPWGSHNNYVCNYGPGGNVRGAAMYQAGEACSRCPEGTNCEDGLCG